MFLGPFPFVRVAAVNVRSAQIGYPRKGRMGRAFADLITEAEAAHLGLGLFWLDGRATEEEAGRNIAMLRDLSGLPRAIADLE